MKKTSIALLVASAFAAPAAFAADAISASSGTRATSLNTGGTGGTAPTTVGNANGSTTINGGGTGVTINSTATTVGGTLRVNGATTTRGITNTGNIATGTLNTTGAATLNSAAVTTNATVGGTLGVTGATTTAGIANTGVLTQNGTTTFNGATTITGATIVNGATTLNGATSINGALNMNGNALNNLAAGVAGTDAVNLNQLNSAITAIPVAAGTVIDGGKSVVGSGTTIAGTRQVNIGGTGANVDANGKITVGAVSQATASMTVTNGMGNTHGFVVNETQATISGGVNSTSLTLNDSGATFSNAATGAPVKVTGVANGTSAYDAVNYQQLQQLQANTETQFKQQAAGIAGVTAMTNIPQVDQNKTFSLGVGLGGYQSQGAIAFGGSFRTAPNAVIKASVSTGMLTPGSRTTTFGVGGAVSW
jgi:hypothetical protein